MVPSRRVLLLVCCFAAGAVAAEPPGNDAAGTKQEAPLAVAPAPGSAAPTARPPLPDQFKLNMMIRTTIIAVNQANKTNNYTVLRDLGSPRFKEGNSAQRLAAIFETLRNSKFDLSPVLFFTPKLLVPPALIGNGMLRLTGFFDTRPQRISFDMLFEDVKGDWQLFGINIATKLAPAAVARGAAPAASGNPSENNKK